MLERILILDLNYHLQRALHVKAFAELMDDFGRKTGGVFGLLSTIQTCLMKCSPCDKVVGVWDGGRSPRRLAMFPPNVQEKTGYKVSRIIHEGMDPSERQEKEELRRVASTSVELATPLLLAAGVHVVRWPEREADDVIALLANRLAGFYAGQVIICSDDWDFAQCCSERVCVYRPMADDWLSLYNFMEKLSVPVDWYAVRKAILGKNGDDVPGVSGVGKVWAGKAVHQFLSSSLPGFKQDYYDSHQYRDTCPADLTQFFDCCERDSRKKVQSIGKNRSLVLRNLELVDFALEVFPQEHVDVLLGGLLTSRAFDEMEVIRQLGELNVNSVLNNFAYWSEPFRRIS